MNEFVENIACDEKLWRKTDHSDIYVNDVDRRQ